MGLLKLIDRSTRRVLALGIVTLVIVIATAVVVVGNGQRYTGAIDPTPMFPGLFNNADEVSSFSISSREGEIYITRGEDNQWVVPARAGFPASDEMVRQTLVGLGELELIEAKTANPGWHHFLRLGAPDEGGEGIEIELFDSRGNTIAAVIVGKQPDGGSVEVDGRGRIYVRRPGDDQTWLARGSLTLRTSVTEWLSSRLVFVGRDRIQSAEVRFADGEGYSVSRETPARDDYTLEDLPVGREVLSRFIVNGVATALVDLEADDVAPAASYDFSNADQIIYRTFDGLEVTIRFSAPDEDGQRWATVSARFPGTPDSSANEAVEIAAEMADINRLADGWAFLLPDYKVRQMTLERNSLLRPPPEDPQP